MVELGRTIIISLRHNLLASQNIVILTRHKTGVTAFMQQALRGAGYPNDLVEGAIQFTANDKPHLIIPFESNDEYFPPMNSIVFSE